MRATSKARQFELSEAWPGLRWKGHVARAKVLVFAVVVAGWLFQVIPAVAESSATGEIGRVMSILESNLSGIPDRGPTSVQVSLVEYQFPRASENEIQEIIDKQRAEVNSRFVKDPTYIDRMAAIDYNVRAELANHVRERSTLVVTTKGNKWRMDHVIEEREEKVQVPRSLEGNRFLKQFRLDLNRSRTYAWDGEAHRVLFVTEDRLTRNGQIYSGDRNRALVDQTLQLGQVPRVLMETILKANIQVEIASETPEAVELKIREEGSERRARIVLAPQYGYAVLALELDTGQGTYLSSHYGGYREVEGAWLPTHVVEEWSRSFDAQRRPIKRREWKVEAVTFRAVIEDENATFAPPMPEPASVVDYRFDPPLRYRTDEGMHVSDEQIDALIAVLDQATARTDLSEQGATGVDATRSSVPGASSDDRLPPHISRAELETRRKPGGWRWYASAGLVGLLLLLMGLTIRVFRNRNGQTQSSR